MISEYFPPWDRPLNCAKKPSFIGEFEHPRHERPSCIWVLKRPWEWVCFNPWCSALSFKGQTNFSSSSSVEVLVSFLFYLSSLQQLILFWCYGALFLLFVLLASQRVSSHSGEPFWELQHPFFTCKNASGMKKQNLDLSALRNKGTQGVQELFLWTERFRR